MKLTDTAIRNALPKEKPYKMADGNGLYLLVKPAGKYWRMDYTFRGKRKTLSLGVYPRVKLKAARKKCLEAKDFLDEGIDPGQKKKMDKLSALEGNTFKTVALEWYKKNLSIWQKGYADQILRRLELNIFPWIGDKDIKEILPLELLAVLRRIEDRGAIELTHRMKQTCGQIYRYAIITGKAEYDISSSLKEALTVKNVKHRSTILDPVQVGQLLDAIDGYGGSFVTRCAFKIAPMIFLRPGELRKLEWIEIDFKKAEMKIPAEKMKMKRPHIVPIARQVMEVLSEIHPFTHHRSKYVFPSIARNDRPLSQSTIVAALRRLDYGKETMSGHGFRAMASTLLHENEWPADLIELQLAHVEKSSVRAAYNHALHLKKRREMMQWWADYLDKLKSTCVTPGV